MNGSPTQRIGLALAAILLIAFGLFVAAASWPQTRTIEHQRCDPIARTCTTIVQTYKVGSEGAVLLGAFLAAFAAALLLIVIAQYVRMMFSATLRLLRRAFSAARIGHARS